MCGRKKWLSRKNLPPSELAMPLSPKLSWNGRSLVVVVVVAALVGSGYAFFRSSSLASILGREVPAIAAVPSSVGPIRVVLGEPSEVCHDIGDVSRGGRRQVSFVVANRGSSAVSLGAFRVSCECLRVELDSVRIEPGAEVQGRAVIDLAGEPKFVGGLMLDAEASVLEGSRTLFVLKLSAQVK